MQTQFFPAGERGIKDGGWLKSNFFFSFSNYANPVKSAFGTLVAFNDDFLQSGKGFGIHPHINMEIISVMLKGKMNYKGSMGYCTTVEEGGVQIMSAGNGLRHEEYNIGDEEVNFPQVWIQPKLQNIILRYQQRSFPKDGRKNQLKTIISSEEGKDHCWINQNAKLSLGYFEKGKEIRYDLNPVNEYVFIFLIDGDISVGDKNLEERDALGTCDTDSFAIDTHKDFEFLIIEAPVNQK